MTLYAQPYAKRGFSGDSEGKTWAQVTGHLAASAGRAVQGQCGSEDNFHLFASLPWYAGLGNLSKRTAYKTILQRFPAAHLTALVWNPLRDRVF
jgi:IS5 family transposase